MVQVDPVEQAEEDPADPEEKVDKTLWGLSALHLGQRTRLLPPFILC